MTPAITIENISFSYGNRPVLKNVSFQVPQGEVFIIIGPNGSGKTTLIKLLSGIAGRQQGSISLMGQPIQNYTQKRLAGLIAYVPQGLPLGFPFAVEETVLMGRAPHQNVFGVASKSDVDVAHEAMGFTEVTHLAKRRLDQLSGGEQQRVLIARALCQQPQVIFLDEPTAALDLSHQVGIMDLMEKMKCEKGTTIVLVSHDVNLAAMYADQLLLLNKGAIESIGLPQSVLTYQQLEKTYGCKLVVDKSPIDSFPRVTLVPNRLLNYSSKLGHDPDSAREHQGLSPRRQDKKVSNFSKRPKIK